MNTPTIDLADWVSSLRYPDLPSNVVIAARAALLDALACGLYGSKTRWAGIVADWVAAKKGVEQAMVLGRFGLRVPACDAALANGVAIHSFELDDYHNAKIHPGAVVIAAAIAVAQLVRASGQDLITAVVAGYEAMIRVALGLNPGPARARGWHLTGVCGPFGAAAAACVLMHLNAKKTASAFGLAGTQGAGLFAFNNDGSMSKRLHPGRAAQSGIMAVELAASGLEGPVAILEAEDGGFLRTFSDSSRPQEVTSDLGRDYHLTRVAFKPYPCCGSLHGCVQAALNLVKKRGEPFSASASVRVGIPELVDLQCGYDYRPSTLLHAQMSLRYSVAAALLEGRLGPEQFEQFKLHDPETVSLAQQLKVIVDPELNALYPAHFLGWVEVEEDGSTLKAFVQDPRGSPAFPMEWNDLEEKFQGLVGPLLSPKAAREIIDTVAYIDKPGMIADLLHSLEFGMVSP